MPRIPQKLREDRREAILQAAVDCLAEHGYRGTTMRLIAQAVGLTKGGLYPYFENKDAILVAVADRHLARLVELLKPHPGVGAAEQLTMYLEEFEANFHDPRHESARRAVLDLWLSAGDSPVVRDNIERRFRSIQSALAGLVRRGQAEGVFRRDAVPEEVGALVLAVRDGMLFQALKLGAKLPTRALIRLLREMLFEALGPAPRRTAQARAKHRRPAARNR